MNEEDLKDIVRKYILVIRGTIINIWKSSLEETLTRSNCLKNEQKNRFWVVKNFNQFTRPEQNLRFVFQKMINNKIIAINYIVAKEY